MKDPLVVDIETVGTAPRDGKVVTLSWMTTAEQHAHVEAVGHVTRQAPYPEDLLEMMADPERPFVSFTKYDARFMRLIRFREAVEAGHTPDQAVEIAFAFVTGPFYDIQTQCWVDNENQSLSLDSCARRYLHIQMDKRIKVRGGQVFFECDSGLLVPVDEAPLEQLYRYNVDDTQTECALFLEMWERLRDGEWLDYWRQEEVPFTGVLVDMECRGIPIDMVRSEQLREELEVSHAEDESELMAQAGLPSSFNLNSGPMMAAYLFSPAFEMADALPTMPGEYNGMPRDEKVIVAQEVIDHLGLSFTVGSVGRTYIHGVWTLPGRGLRGGPRTPKGDRFATSKPALKVNLATASDPWCQQFLDFRATGTLLSTYLRRFPERVHEGRIYGRFNQTGTKTGRLSSSEPNLQNIPSHGELGPRVRDIFRVAA